MNVGIDEYFEISALACDTRFADADVVALAALVPEELGACVEVVEVELPELPQAAASNDITESPPANASDILLEELISPILYYVIVVRVAEPDELATTVTQNWNALPAKL